MTARRRIVSAYLALRLAGLVLAMSFGAAHAERHALLVGVSAYPSLGKDQQLQGPANDVRRMRDALLQRGFTAGQVQVLADGVDGAAGLPTRQAILTALGELARNARPGDTVVFHFSGHGSQQPMLASAEASRREADGWQETILPRDVGGWDGKRGTVTNAITDTAMREAIDRISDAGAFVWAIFDACHSGALVRGADEGLPAERTRQLAPADLGLREIAPAPRLRAGARSVGPPGPGASRRGLAAYFYAAQSDQAAVEMALPKGTKGAPTQGLFSYTLSRAIASGQAMSYRQLGQHVLAQYGTLFEAHATPLFTGDGLGEPVLALRASRYLQWALDQRRGSLSVPAGSLDGVAVGAMFAVLRDPLASTTDASSGFLRAAAVEAGRSELQPVEWQGRPMPAPASLAPGTFVRLVSSPPSFALRVAADLGACRAECSAKAAVERLRRDGVAGVEIRWVTLDDAPDVVLQATPGGLRYRIAGEAAGPPLGAVPALGAALPRPREADAAAAAQRIATDLHSLARARNLLQLAALLAVRSTAAGLDMSLRLRPALKTAAESAVGAEQVPTLNDGDGLVLTVRNRGQTAVDFTLLLVDANHGITVRYPLDFGESNRIEPGATLKLDDLTVNTLTTGTERLVLVWAEMRKHRERRDFSFLQQSPLERVRGDADPELQALIDACFADQLTRADQTSAPPSDSLGMQVFTFRVKS